jgi:protocatechuate 3,4-dioxygenase beta subunit
MNESGPSPSRRQILAAGAFGITSFMLGQNAGLAQQSLAPTLACHDGDEPTIGQTEGPFFRPHSPHRSDLRLPGIDGRPVELSGYVLTRSCRPIPGTLVDLWHADNNGEYDTAGSRLRGHVFADGEGRFRFRTIVPGLYPGRTRHYHLKIHAAGGASVLTTQFYFPDEKRNRTDGLFRRELLMQVADANGTLRAHFDVVL